MNIIRTSILAAVAASLTACASVETASRNAPYQPEATTSAAQPAPQATQLRIASFDVKVPETLKVSEANAYYPKGDIVWRGDPMGNRHMQVKAIFDESLSRSATMTKEGNPVAVEIVVTRFHAITEKARYTVGGVHAITFQMSIHDPKTGKLLADPRMVEADLEAFGGDRAIEAEANGLTQKTRIVAHLAEVVRQELTRPQGYRNETLGFFQAVNKL